MEIVTHLSWYVKINYRALVSQNLENGGDEFNKIFDVYLSGPEWFRFLKWA